MNTISTAAKTSKKILFFGQEARKKLIDGIQLINKATKTTMGPGGRNVALEYEAGSPKITKDGVTVAKSIFFV